MSLQQKAVKRQIDCDDCGNSNCQLSDHARIYETSVKLSDVLLAVQELMKKELGHDGKLRAFDFEGNQMVVFYKKDFDSVFGVKK